MHLWSFEAIVLAKYEMVLGRLVETVEPLPQALPQGTSILAIVEGAAWELSSVKLIVEASLEHS